MSIKGNIVVTIVFHDANERLLTTKPILVAVIGIPTKLVSNNVKRHEAESTGKATYM